MRKILLGGALVLSQLTSWDALAEPVRDRPAVPVEGRELGSVIFAQLLVKVDSSDEIAGLTEKYVNKFNNKLREAGYNVPGTEKSLFKEDAYPDTDFMIAGAIVEFDCSGERKKTCGIGVEWEVLDRRNNRVVYKLRARHEEMLLGKMRAVEGAEAMLLGTLESLMAREKFVESLAKSDVDVAPAAPTHEERTIRSCSAEPKVMPKGSEYALQATVLVKEKDGIGSGVFISPDGFILTAAHVVSQDTVEVRTKNGKSYQADVLRIDEGKDVALLRLQEPPSETPCLQLDVGTAPAGEDVYALGSPAGEELSFSISRGIVSGARTIEGTSYVQTDAPINPGNSGGPLVNGAGRVMAIASWKVAHEKMEGLGFGVPSSTALSALGIVLGDHTDTVARSVSRTPTDTSSAFVDEADPDWYYIGKDAPGRTPTWVPLTRMFGYLTAGLGLTAVVGSWVPHVAGDVDAQTFGTLRTINTIGWAGFGVGVGMVVSSYVFRPDNRAPSERDQARGLRPSAFAVGPGNVTVRWTF